MRTFLRASAALALLTGTAAAADLPLRAAPVPAYVPPPFTWTGLFIGTHSSYLFSDRQRILTTGDPLLGQPGINAGFIASGSSTKVERLPKLGGSFGLNYQLTPGTGFVVGGVFTIDWTDVNKNAIAIAPNALGGAGTNLVSVYNQQLDYLGTVNGRIGYAFDNAFVPGTSVLVYATGGLAFGRSRFGSSIYLPAFSLVSPVVTGGNGSFDTGYNYGGGIEVALPKGGILDKLDLLPLLGINIGGSSTLRAEYIRYDLGSSNVVASLGALSTNTRFQTEGSIVRVGFNYKFP